MMRKSSDVTRNIANGCYFVKISLLPAVIHNVTTRFYSFAFSRQQSILSFIIWHSSEIIKTAMVLSSLSVYGRAGADAGANFDHTFHFGDDCATTTDSRFVIAADGELFIPSFPLPSFLPSFLFLLLAAGSSNEPLSYRVRPTAAMN